jgi:hypothetical protein
MPKRAVTTDAYSDEKYAAIKKLVDEGVLGPEQCPEASYWHWPVYHEELLPDFLKADYNTYGEVRLY